jgi:hypothetical protein
LRIEQSGFRPDKQHAFAGAQAGRPQFLSNLEELLSKAD